MDSTEYNPLDDYNLGEVMGRGSTSLVYAAVRKTDGERVAIKETKMFELPEEKRERCLKEFTAAWSVLGRANPQEVQLLQCLHHPNIISLDDSFLTENNLVLVLEYADGDLRQLIEKQRAAGFLLLERHVWALFSQLTGALRYMHGKRIMHRDLKPSNVLVTEEGLKLGDLGLGRQFSSQTHEAFSKVGTPYYVSPEVIGGAGYDFKSDVWSLGCMLYELATLQNPFEFEGATLAGVFGKIIRAEYAQLEGAQFSDTLKSLVQSMLAVEPAKRPTLNDIDDLACKQYLSLADAEEPAVGGSSPTPLEALAHSIRPKYSAVQRSTGHNVDTLTGGLPNTPVLPAINEIGERNDDSHRSFSGASSSFSGNSRRSVGGDAMPVMRTPSFPMRPLEEIVHVRGKKAMPPGKGTPSTAPAHLVHKALGSRSDGDYEAAAAQEDKTRAGAENARVISDAPKSGCCVVA